MGLSLPGAILGGSLAAHSHGYPDLSRSFNQEAVYNALRDTTLQLCLRCSSSFPQIHLLQVDGGLQPPAWRQLKDILATLLSTLLASVPSRQLVSVLGGTFSRRYVCLAALPLVRSLPRSTGPGS